MNMYCFHKFISNDIMIPWEIKKDTSSDRSLVDVTFDA